MITIPLLGQSYTLQQLGSKSAPEIRWYLDKDGQVRIDAAKPIIQILELQARKYQSLQPLYKESMTMVDQAIEANLFLQKGMVELQLDAANLAGEVNTLSLNYNTLKQENSDIRKDLEKQQVLNQELKSQTRQYKRERNFAAFATIIVVIAAIIAK